MDDVADARNPEEERISSSSAAAAGSKPAALSTATTNTANLSDHEVQKCAAVSRPAQIPDNKEVAQPQRNLMPATARLFIFLFVVVGVLSWLTYGMPTTVRTFVAVSTAAGTLVIGGLITLIFLIPTVGSNPDIKTEFHSARAAYLCVLAGLLLFTIVAVGAVFAGVMKAVGGK